MDDKIKKAGTENNSDDIYATLNAISAVAKKLAKSLHAVEAENSDTDSRSKDYAVSINKMAWRSAIEQAALKVARKYCFGTVDRVFERYGACNFDDLDSRQYRNVLDELEQIIEDED